jgi:hypothetical protein
MNKNLIWQALLSLSVRSFKIVPGSARFGLGKMGAQLLLPFARRFSLISPKSFALGSDNDYLWSTLFSSLTHHGVTFDPKIVWRGPAAEPPKGSIFVSGHFYLNFFVIRALHDNGLKQSTVIRDEYERQPVFGTTEKIDVIKPTAKSLREIKKRVDAGEIVTICIDHSEPIDGWTRLDIPDRQIYISEAIFKFAERLQIPLVFFGTQVNAKKEIEIHTVRPVSTKASEITAEFTEFLKPLLAANNL